MASEIAIRAMASPRALMLRTTPLRVVALRVSIAIATVAVWSHNFIVWWIV